MTGIKRKIIANVYDAWIIFLNKFSKKV